MEHEIVEWSAAQGWLALASFGSNVAQINFFTHAGTKTEGVPLARSCRATSIEWHPNEVLIAVGWVDGALTLSTPTRNPEETLNDLEMGEITKMKWSSDGLALCVGDQAGRLVVLGITILHTELKTKRLFDTELGSQIHAICYRAISGSGAAPENPSQSPRQEVELQEDDLETSTPPARKNGFRNLTFTGSSAWIGVFFIGTNKGEIEALVSGSNMIRTFSISSPVAQLHLIETKSMLIALGGDMMIWHILIASDNTGAEKIKVKLPGRLSTFSMVVAEPGLLFMASAEKEIRVWDIISEENYTLPLQQQCGFEATDIANCITYSKKKGMISAGTQEGKVATWRRRGGSYTGANAWKLHGAVFIGSRIVDLKWSPTSAALAVNTGFDITILQEDNIVVHFHNKIAGVQMGQNHFTLVNTITGVSQDLKLAFLAKGIHIADKQLVVWSDDTVTTYDVQTSLATFQATSFQCSPQIVALSTQSLYCLENDKINVRTLQGTLKQVISLPEMEGEPMCMDVNGQWMAVGSSNGFVRIYDLRGRDAKQEYHAKYVVESIAEFFKFIGIKLNATGTKVACTFLEKMNEQSDKVLIWDAEADNVGYFSFNKGMTDQQEYEAEAEASLAAGRPQTAAVRKLEREQTRFRMPYHKPGQFHWDAIDPRFLVFEAIYQNPEIGDNLIVSMFATSEHGIQLHDIQPRSAQCDSLIGVQVPHLFFIKKSEYEEEEVRHERTIGRLLIARTMREFAGLEHSDEATRKALLDFCFYLTIGQMDDAFKSIKFIKSESVWEHMAAMSVKTRRLDVASLCLGHMGLARAARALRRSQRQGDVTEVQCATLAIQLGMLDEAQALYTVAGRYDLVNKMLQAQNAWTPAFDVAEKHDRIHIRNTHYNYGTYLESVGAIEPAVDHFEKSGTHHFEVPRMFTDNPKILENYVRRKRDPELQRWWARYLESIGELEGALNFYAVATDHLSVVRIKCLQGRLEEAAKVASESGDQAACYHLGRNYEAHGQFDEAVDFYGKAHAFSSAIRLAREHDMRDRLANLSLMAGGSDLIETAKYYEDLPGHAHRAVMLYHKAKMIGRALDLAFRTEQFSALDLIAKDLTPETDSNTLKRAAEFFASNQNFEKAVELLCFAKDFSAAIEMCMRRNVRMSERLAELLTPTKESTPEPQLRKKLLEDVAELCLRQGSYAFAAKKYTQAGDKESAMRALIKSGDTAKIRFFATTARSKAIYILAANFLQTTDWRGDAEVMREIEIFYGKAQSQEHLANFYIACAQMEIEDYRDFAKAADALGEAEKSVTKGLEKAPNAALNELQSTTHRFQKQLEKFQTIKGVYESDPTDAVRQLTTLAEEANEDDLIRPSHIFSLLIGHHAGKQNWNAAHRCILQLKKQQPNVDLSTVVPVDVLDKVCDEMGAERVTGKAAPTGAESDDEAEQIDFSHALQRQTR
ncbi:unnamed protein product, partial [Mesorhabditis belari]|uniref:Uncharacterized protein n=1 Tax=Mesorhabditis belari TaxID=2138241 RepID=A0AAF3E834_9BILA